jgi:hypothetical protein
MIELGNQTEKRTNTNTVSFVHVTPIAKFTTSRKERADNIMQSGARKSIHFRQTVRKILIFPTMITLPLRSTTSTLQIELIMLIKKNYFQKFPKSGLNCLWPDSGCLGTCTASGRARRNPTPRRPFKFLKPIAKKPRLTNDQHLPRGVST